MDVDEQLDQRLREATPPVSARTPEIRRELDALVVAVTPVQRRRRRMTRASLVAATAVGALGVGTAAAAAGLIPGWSVLTGSGQTCQVDVIAAAAQAGDSEPDATFGATERAEAVVAARIFLEGFDYDSIDRDAAISRWQAVEDAAIAAQPDSAERRPALTGDDLEVTALTYDVTTRLGNHLAARSRPRFPQPRAGPHGYSATPRRHVHRVTGGTDQTHSSAGLRTRRTATSGSNGFCQSASAVWFW